MKGIFRNLGNFPWENMNHYILLLIETWLRQYDQFYHHNYIIYRIDETDSFGECVLFLKCSLYHRVVEFDKYTIPDKCHIQILFLEYPDFSTRKIYSHLHTI